MSKIETFLSSLGLYVRMVCSVLKVICTHPPQLSLIRDQLFQTGVLSFGVVTITGFSTGMVLAAQSYFQLSSKGLSSITGVMVCKSMLVELGPTLTALMITGRVGAAITAQLSSMVVSEQVAALLSMATSPLRYLVAPRVIAMTIMVPLLTIYSALMGTIGGYFIAVFLYGMAPSTFFGPMHAHINWFDPICGLSKALFFGFLISSIACFQGLYMQIKGGAEGVGKATTSSVVTSYGTILIANFILTIGLHAVYWIIFKP